MAGRDPQHLVEQQQEEASPPNSSSSSWADVLMVAGGRRVPSTRQRGLGRSLLPLALDDVAWLHLPTGTWLGGGGGEIMAGGGSGDDGGWTEEAAVDDRLGETLLTNRWAHVGPGIPLLLPLWGGSSSPSSSSLGEGRGAIAQTQERTPFDAPPALPALVLLGAVNGGIDGAASGCSTRRRLLISAANGPSAPLAGGRGDVGPAMAAMAMTVELVLPPEGLLPIFLPPQQHHRHHHHPAVAAKVAPPLLGKDGGGGTPKWLAAAHPTLSLSLSLAADHSFGVEVTRHPLYAGFVGDKGRTNHHRAHFLRYLLQQNGATATEPTAMGLLHPPSMRMPCAGLLDGLGGESPGSGFLQLGGAAATADHAATVMVGGNGAVAPPAAVVVVSPAMYALPEFGAGAGVAAALGRERQLAHRYLSPWLRRVRRRLAVQRARRAAAAASKPLSPLLLGVDPDAPPPALCACCRVAPVSFVLEPCGHFSACETCAAGALTCGLCGGLVRGSHPGGLGAAMPYLQNLLAAQAVAEAAEAVTRQDVASHRREAAAADHRRRSAPGEAEAVVDFGGREGEGRGGGTEGNGGTAGATRRTPTRSRQKGEGGGPPALRLPLELAGPLWAAAARPNSPQVVFPGSIAAALGQAGFLPAAGAPRPPAVGGGRAAGALCYLPPRPHWSAGQCRLPAARPWEPEVLLPFGLSPETASQRLMLLDGDPLQHKTRQHRPSDATAAAAVLVAMRQQQWRVGEQEKGGDRRLLPPQRALSHSSDDGISAMYLSTRTTLRVPTPNLL